MTDETVVEQTTETAVETQTVAETPKPTAHQEFLSGLPEELRAHPSFIKFNGESKDEIISKLAGSYVNIEKLVGADKNHVLKFPSSDDDKEAWDSVYEKLGRPADVTGYEIEKFKDTPGVDVEILKGVAEVAHENGVSKKALNAIVETYFKQAGLSMEQSETALEETLSGYDAALKKEWGQAYEQKANKIQTALREKADPEFLELAKQFPTIVDHPAFVKTIDNILKMTDEDAGVKTGGASTNSALTPDEAKAQIAAMQGDADKMKALTNKDHPQHAAVIAERSKLFKAAYGS
jgi:hypothetical protein